MLPTYFSANGRHEVLCNHYQLVRDSKIHNEYQNFEKLRVKRFHEVENVLAQLERKRTAALDNGDEKAYGDYPEFVRLKQMELDKVFMKARHEHILKNPNSVVSVYLLSNGADVSKNMGFYRYVNKQLTEDFANHPYTVLFRKKLLAAERMKAGDQKISFTAKK